MSVDAVIRMKQKQYEATIVDYITHEKGHLIALSDDQPFLTLLRMTLLKYLALNNSTTILAEPGQLLRTIREVSAEHPSPILFMERLMGGRELSYLVRQFKDAYPALRIIVLTSDVEKERLMLLHEVGADNFVAKPVSTNTLIEKIAFTLKPQSKLGQLIDAAKALVLQEKPQDALRLSQQILELKPNSAAGYLVMGDAYRKMGDLDKSRQSYERASEYAELFMEPLRRLAELHGETGDATSRLRCLERLDTLSPLNVERKVDMGELHLSMGNNNEAERLFNTAVDQITRDALNNITNIASRIASIYSEKDPLKAEAFLRRSLDAKGKMLSREDLNTFNQLGINLRQQGRWKDAIDEYKKALKLAPDDENLYYNMGMACAEGRDFAEARVNIIKALEINPNLPQASANLAYNIGIVFMYAGSRDLAAKHLRTAVELNPALEAAKAALAKVS